ncbi:hypothetical protein GCM10029992_19590 [Glycomyces albus]
MAETMDPDEVRDYAGHFQQRIEDADNQEYINANDSNPHTALDNMTEGLVMRAVWFGPAAMWESDVATALEDLHRARANEAYVLQSKLQYIKDTIEDVADSWESDEAAATRRFEELEDEMR